MRVPMRTLTTCNETGMGVTLYVGQRLNAELKVILATHVRQNLTIRATALLVCLSLSRGELRCVPQCPPVRYVGGLQVSRTTLDVDSHRVSGHSIGRTLR